MQDRTRKVSRRSEFPGWSAAALGLKLSQGSAVIRVSREEQEAVMHILRLLSRSMAGREQDAGWAATR